MRLEHPLNDIAASAPVDGGGLGFDARTRLRIGISGADGASTLAWHAVLPPGAARARHAANLADEIVICLAGGGTAEIGGHKQAMRAGHCQFVPKGVTHAFAAGDGAETVLVGFNPFAGSPGATGRAPGGASSAAPAGGALVHLDDVAPAAMDRGDGWFITDFRLPIGAHTGSSTTLFRARFFPGAVHKKHRHDACEEIYFVISGGGIAGAGRDRVRVHGGHFHYVPRGVEHWLHNTSDAEPIEVVGVYIGAGSVAATEYVYMGDVTPADLASVR